MKQLIVVNLMIFILVFMIAFILFSIFYSRKSVKNGIKKPAEVNYIMQKFNIDKKKTKYRNLLFNISLINSFIIAFSYTILRNIESYVLGLLIGFIILIVLFYSLYEITGRIYMKKGSK